MVHKWGWKLGVPHNVEVCMRPGCKWQRKTGAGKKKSDEHTYRLGDGEWVDKVPECSKVEAA